MGRKQETPAIQVFDTPYDLAEAAAGEFFTRAQEAIQLRDRVTVVLSGGHTPLLLYALLARRPEFPWGKVHFFWGDERGVPPDSPESNFGSARKALLSKIPIPPENIHRIPTELGDPAEAAREYEAEIVRFFSLQPGEWPVFDLVFLGIGADGHTASLFPRSPALHEEERLVASVRPENSGGWRITLTPPVFRQAAREIFLVAGAEKTAALRRAMEEQGNSEETPARLVQPIEGDLLWLVDRGAAGSGPPLAYRSQRFLESDDARPLRILSEYLHPLHAFRRARVHDTIVFFGSARLAEHGPLSSYYDAARELARLVTQWSKDLKTTKRHFLVCTGGGGGIMEAANRGASEVGGRTIGLNIGLPHEQRPNPYITRELNFEFRYFFMRKLWFAYPARAMVVFPGGFGTMDELFEMLTLSQTGKLARPIIILLYGSSYWKELINFEALVRHGMISPEDLTLFRFVDHPVEALDALRESIEPEFEARTPAIARSLTPSTPTPQKSEREREDPAERDDRGEQGDGNRDGPNSAVPEEG